MRTSILVVPAIVVVSNPFINGIDRYNHNQYRVTAPIAHRQDRVNMNIFTYVHHACVKNGHTMLSANGEKKTDF